MKPLVLALALVLGLCARVEAAPKPFSECLSPTSTKVTIGRVECQRVSSKALGGQTPFSYYVPKACVGRACPVLYLLHGTGSSYQGMLGEKGQKKLPAWVKALTHRPYVNAAKHPAPWTLKTDRWVKATPLPFVLVAPHNRTLPGGFGPRAWLDGLWSDWNPRYARGGDHQVYRTPAPRFETYIVKELLPFVEKRLPVGTSRGYRGMIGHSQGGFGAVKIPLAHPDKFSAVGSQSGGSLPLGRLARVSGVGVGFQPPVATSYIGLAGAGPYMSYPYGTTSYVFLPSLMPGYGDPATDGVYYQSQAGSGIAENARAFQSGRQAIAFRLTVGDAIPRRHQDFTTKDYAYSQAYEVATQVTTHEMARALRAEAVNFDLFVHPGLHGSPYQAPHYRNMLEFMWRNMKHPDGKGSVVTRPDRFDYRSIRKEFGVWGWKFLVSRRSVEFLNLTDVSCTSVTMRGTGKVAVTVPALCKTGLRGQRRFTVDLGPSQTTDEPHAAGAYPTYGRTRTVKLTAR